MPAGLEFFGKAGSGGDEEFAVEIREDDIGLLKRADALRAQRSAVANVVKALGGGWTGLPGTETVPAQAQSGAAAP